MATRIALLRAVNVGGTGKIAMAELRAFMEALGFTEVRTLIQTGNIVFEGAAPADAELEALLETEAAARLGLETSFFVRGPEEWRQAIAANPFPEKAESDPKRMYLVALKEAPSPESVAGLRESYEGPERFEAVGRHLYIDYPDGVGNSKFTNVLIERRLATRGTARNWNTVLRIAEMAGK